MFKECNNELFKPVPPPVLMLYKKFVLVNGIFVTEYLPSRPRSGIRAHRKPLFYHLKLFQIDPEIWFSGKTRKFT
jgi:hypothetical protein